MNSQVTILAIIFFSTFSTTAISPGCVSIEAIPGVKKCALCYKRKFSSDGVCGALQPESDPCQFYSYIKSTKSQLCIQCKPGYALLETFSNNTPSTVCQKGVIPGCAIETIQMNTRYHFCLGCENNKYAAFTKGKKSSYCTSVKSPVTHCKLGARVSDFHKDGPTCSKCELGYAVDLTTGKCQPSVVPGCSEQAQGSCFFCDGENGFFMNAQKRCYKPAGTEKA